jgi:hypothetical protein
MAGFLTELDVRCLDDGYWKLEAPLRYASDILGHVGRTPEGFTIAVPCIITVPAGFLTDFASVPRVPIVFWFWGDRAHREAVLHDYLYRVDSDPVVERSRADRAFLEAMGSRGKSWGVRWPMYLGVRIGGGAAYHRKYVAV